MRILTCFDYVVCIRPEVARKVRKTPKTNPRNEYADLSLHLQSNVLTDDQIADIESFCSEISEGLENASFEQRWHVVDLLDVRGKLAIENEEKVIYVKCIIGQQLLSVALTSHSSNTGGITIQTCVSLLTARSR